MTYYGRTMDTEHPTNCVALTWEDAEKAEKLNAECGWGFSASDCLRFIADHMEAYTDTENGNDVTETYRCMESIEWRLIDANFHTLSQHLGFYNYKEAIEWVMKEVM